MSERAGIKMESAKFQTPSLERCVVIAKARLANKSIEPEKKKALEDFISVASSILENLSRAKDPDTAVFRLISLAKELGLTESKLFDSKEERTRQKVDRDPRIKDGYVVLYGKLQKRCDELRGAKHPYNKKVWQSEVDEIDEKISRAFQALEAGEHRDSDTYVRNVLQRINILRSKLEYPFLRRHEI